MNRIPSTFMQGLIALLLIGNFTLVLIGPSVFPGWVAPDEAYKQTLVNLVILAVGYYLGSSSGSARKDEINATQQTQAITALSPTPPPSPPPPIQRVEVTNTPSNPVPTDAVPS